ncbi:MAG: sugar phosphate isomerase/epimerase family protein [Anaerolineae bacterium]
MLLASNHMFPSGSIEAVFERLADAGAGGLDLFLPHIPYLKQSPNDSKVQIEYFRRNLVNCRLAAEAAGLPIRSIIGMDTPDGHGFTSYQATDADKGRADALEWVRYNVEIAMVLGAKHICSGEGSNPPGAERDDIWNRLVKTLRDAAPICEKAGITLNLETHPDYITSDPQLARRLIEEVGSLSIRICLDFCHANINSRGDPVSVIEALAGVVGTVHISDGTQVTSLHIPIGCGDIDVDACIKAVKKTGFAGIWSLCMYGCAFPEFTFKTAVRFLKEKHPDILK